MFHQLCFGAACHPAPRICSVPGHGPLPHSAPEELAAGDTDGRCRALEAGPSPAMRAVAAWEPAKLAMGRCGARDVVCRDMLESSHDPLPRGSGRRQPLQSPRCRPPVAVAELNISTCVRHVPHFIFHWAHHDRHVFEYRRWPLRYQVSLVSPVSRPARHPHFSRIPIHVSHILPSMSHTSSLLPLRQAAAARRGRSRFASCVEGCSRRPDGGSRPRRVVELPPEASERQFGLTGEEEEPSRGRA